LEGKERDSGREVFTYSRSWRGGERKEEVREIMRE
jgi:hypothetical protein